jgi:hypothetical protein
MRQATVSLGFCTMIRIFTRLSSWSASNRPDDVNPMKHQVGQCIEARQDIFMTIEFRAVEATCRRIKGNT